MAGTIVANTINTDTGLFSTQNAYSGIAKAWVQFAGSTGTIAGSFNVSSVTRLGTGRYTVNFTTAMSNANYAVSASCSPSGANAALGVNIFSTDGNVSWTTSAPTTTTFSFITPIQSTNMADMPYVCAVVFGA